MIDFHTHTILSDGELLASELVRRAEVKGYEAIAITDHVDWSNIDFIVPHIAKVAKKLSSHWKIKVIPGVEITHVPIEEMASLIKFARTHGAHVVLLHGETTSEPVLKGTNRKAIECGVDILAHPGNLTLEEAMLAKEKGVYLEITTRHGHQDCNRHVAGLALKTGARMVLNTDTHKAEDMITADQARQVLRDAGLDERQVEVVLQNSKALLNTIIARHKLSFW